MNLQQTLEAQWTRFYKGKMSLNCMRKEAAMTDLTYDCLEKMDQLIYQSVRGIHLLFEKNDIVKAVTDYDPDEEENSLERLKQIQDLLYTFIQLKTVEEKRAYLGTLQGDDYFLLIRAYFKIVDNSILSDMDQKH